MADTRLTFYCTAADVDLIAEALREMTSRPVHVWSEQVFGLDFSDASAQESVTGQLDRRAIELAATRSTAQTLIDRVAALPRKAPVRWHLTPIEAEGRLS